MILDWGKKPESSKRTFEDHLWQKRSTFPQLGYVFVHECSDRKMKSQDEFYKQQHQAMLVATIQSAQNVWFKMTSKEAPT